MLDIPYEPKKIEDKWQKRWEELDIFNVKDDPSKSKYYLLEMFPYPSGKIHMGHVRNYTIGDVITRFKRMNNYNVLHPMGWDAFGLPAENAAISNNIHPAKWTYDNIDYMKKQLKKLGFSYDWKREVATCDENYYKWEQMFFIKMYEKGLAYRSKGNVNWCEKCATVLANEQVEDGVCWRCGTEIEIKELEHWYFKITDYAEELLDFTYKLPGWPEKVLVMQRNWIGKSFGSELKFQIKGSPDFITVFTTRPDTIFGATFMSIAPEHPIIDSLVKGEAGDRDKIISEINEMKKEDKIKRTSEDYEKKGVWTGSYCINPANGREIPIFVANFVLMDYGTGAVMAVPAHDQRDFDFAKKYNLPIIPVIKPIDKDIEPSSMEKAYEEEGILFNSEQFNGTKNIEAMDLITKWLAEKNLGKRSVNYRLRDWSISRQRYWGAPIPIIYCDKCGVVPIPVDQLPVVLPKDVQFTSSSDILKQLKDFVKTKCPKCGGDARRETDTMDTFVESSWYYIKYASPNTSDTPFDQKAVDYWLPVDQYIGGIEHAVLHLLYSRFFTKVLRDFGYIKFDEPFTNLLTQGMVCKETHSCPEHGWLFPEQVNEGNCSICGKQVDIGRSEKMSKSKKNVIDPENIINEYGADTARLFILFASPPDKTLEWSEQGVEGGYRFLKRVWNLVISNYEKIKDVDIYSENDGALDGETKALRRKTHETIKKVYNDINDRFHFNTAISAIMELVNLANQSNVNSLLEKKVLKETLQTIILLLAPFVPHFTDELWSIITGCNNDPLLNKAFPCWDEKALQRESKTIVTQINGKVRGKITVSADMEEAQIKELSINDEKIKTFLEGRGIKNIFYVKDKLINIVTQ